MKRNLFIDDVFFDRYEHYRETSITYIEAYNKTEGEHKVMYGKNKYSNFRSFNSAYNRKRANKIQQC